ncbi:hypothetical protein PGTUg99_034776 [Puccinia graminis f. sp. tritici]|uniref:Uncharacterized protein n=1 Tax=Puccinia graminis f. sp. tritici TaxID=56615 RepID=A0A5B0RN18_PUCGR|nr:hypothetical protein PGTUg99_034776 [Puccinia graminis f. sp. tritici]
MHHNLRDDDDMKNRSRRRLRTLLASPSKRGLIMAICVDSGHERRPGLGDSICLESRPGNHYHFGFTEQQSPDRTVADYSTSDSIAH